MRKGQHDSREDFREVDRPPSRQQERMEVLLWTAGIFGALGILWATALYFNI